MLAGLYPGYFALVMATGIVALALDGAGFSLPALFLSAACGISWLVLTAFFVLRFVLFLRRAAGDLTDHLRGPGYFTWVAGTCVFGSQLLQLHGQLRPAAGLWLTGLVLWFVITYVFFAAVTLRPAKPDLTGSLSGAWLLATVATQSLALLGAQLAGAAEQPSALLLFASTALFLVGSVIYLLVIGLIFYRFTFQAVAPAQLTAPYWINMGALAITTLTAMTLLRVLPAVP